MYSIMISTNSRHARLHVSAGSTGTSSYRKEIVLIFNYILIIILIIIIIIILMFIYSSSTVVLMFIYIVILILLFYSGYNVHLPGYTTFDSPGLVGLICSFSSFCHSGDSIIAVMSWHVLFVTSSSDSCDRCNL